MDAAWAAVGSRRISSSFQEHAMRFRRIPPALGLAALLAVLLLAARPADATPPVNTLGSGEVAILGYDPVAYFTDGKAVKGQAAFEHRWNGAVWRFASAAHRDAFAKEPERYAPRYGGYCAYGVAQGYAVKIDPEAWSVVGDKLYLNYSQGVRKTWSKDVPGYIAQADSNWPKVLGK
jgi:YHS domain-containing protein